MSNKTKPSEEQLLYASVLQKISLGGLGLLVIGFIVYVSGILPPIVPVSKIPEYWGLRVDEFIEKTNMPVGWNWVPYITHGDILSFLGIILLAAGTVVCFAVVLPAFMRKKDTPFVIIVVIQILILLLAASGFVTGGH
ncbi:MAG: DUF1634 domain-containing protein [Nitrospirae bacterium]|nr:DUF1634 domain-containing protein [Nitrospirota bacterium]